MTLIKSISLTVAALGILSIPAQAQHWHGGYGGGHYYSNRPRVSIGIGICPTPYYYPSPYYYAPAPAYYEPAPVVVGREVVVAREVSGDVAVSVQRILGRKGYYTGTVDGELGPRSRAAIRAWQADNGLRVTGQLNSATLRSLGLL